MFKPGKIYLGFPLLRDNFLPWFLISYDELMSAWGYGIGFTQTRQFIVAGNMIL
jgi:hypothetical protein